MPDWGSSSPYGKGWTAQIAGHSRDLLTPHQPCHSAAPGHQASPYPSPYPKPGFSLVPLGTSEKVPFAMIRHLRNPVVTREVEALWCLILANSEVPLSEAGVLLIFLF